MLRFVHSWAALFYKRRQCLTQEKTLCHKLIFVRCPGTLQYNAMQYNAMQCNEWHGATPEKTICHAPFFLHMVSSGARHAIKSYFLSIQLLFLCSFVYKTAAKPNAKKKRSVIFFLYECLDTLKHMYMLPFAKNE